MRLLATPCLSLSLSLSFSLCLASAPALAAPQQHGADDHAPQAEVIERGAQGRATRVRVDGFEVDVCREGQQDSCINPHEAGLDFGGVPIDYWPGRPASEIDHPLPEHEPEAEPTPALTPGKGG